MQFSCLLSPAGWKRMLASDIMFHHKIHWVLNAAVILHWTVQDWDARGCSWVAWPYDRPYKVPKSLQLPNCPLLPLLLSDSTMIVGFRDVWVRETRILKNYHVFPVWFSFFFFNSTFSSLTSEKASWDAKFCLSSGWEGVVSSLVCLCLGGNCKRVLLGQGCTWRSSRTWSSPASNASRSYLGLIMILE